MTETRAGFIALVGAPNAGKSTLLNRMVGAKIAGVTHKVQTTRTRLRGITSHASTQMIFVDTPGLFLPRKRLEKAMVADAWAGFEDADIALLMVEAHRGMNGALREILERVSVRSARTRLVLAINKIDRIKSPDLLAFSAALNAACCFEKTFMISASRGYGVEDVKDWLADSLPEGPWLYSQDQIADQGMNVIAAEITREKLMLRLHQELPYQLTVEPESWEVKKDGSVRVEQIIYVVREGHLGIILGAGGAVIKAVSQSARSDISELIGVPVHLFLRVKCSPDWQNNRARYAAIGLDFSKGT